MLLLLNRFVRPEPPSDRLSVNVKPGGKSKFFFLEEGICKFFLVFGISILIQRLSRLNVGAAEIYLQNILTLFFVRQILFSGK